MSNRDKLVNAIRSKYSEKGAKFHARDLVDFAFAQDGKEIHISIARAELGKLREAGALNVRGEGAHRQYQVTDQFEAVVASMATTSTKGDLLNRDQMQALLDKHDGNKAAVMRELGCSREKIERALKREA